MIHQPETNSIGLRLEIEMAETIQIGNVTKGLVNNRTAFNLANDAFPYLYNFYSWRGRIKKKRGTRLLGRLQIQVLMLL